MDRKVCRIRRFLVLLAILSLLSAGFGAEAAGNATRTVSVPQRMITVVLDDSGSMYGDSMNLSLYALEVFTAMLNKDDKLDIYTLNQSSQNPVLSVMGSDPNRIRTLHQAMAAYTNPSGLTPYKYTKTAADRLKRASSSYEKWLVILSDGVYSDSKLTYSDVQSDLNGWNNDGIHTIFMSIDSYQPYQDNGVMGRYINTRSADILKTVSEISNTIFNHLVLPPKRVTASGSDCILDIDVPIDQLIVFAQGDSVSVGTMTRDGTPLGMTADYEVSGQAGVRMQGHVVRFDAANGSFYDNGTYRVTVTGAKAIEFYYRPAVDLECSLAVTGDLYAGDKQEAQIYFCHPVTRQKITSDLLSGAQMYLTIKNNGKTVKDREPAGPDGKVSEVTLEEGTAELSAQAELPGGVTLNKPATAYTVKKKKTVAGFDQQSGVGANMWTIRQIDLKDNTAVKFTAQVVDENQNLVEEEEWQALTCNGETAHGVKLDVTKTGLSCPEVYVIPSADGKLSDVETGIQDFTVNVISSTGNVTKNTVTINIIPFDPIELKDESATFNQISLGRNNTSEFVTVRAVDPDTKNPLSDGIAALTELSLVSDGGQGLDWLIEKTGNSGEWKLTPRAIGLKADITTGRRTVRLRAVYDDGYDFTGAKALISEADLIVDIIATPPRYLTVDSRVPQDAYIRTRWKLIGSDKIRVTAKYEGQDLPKTVWDAAVDDSLTLTAVGNGVGKKIDFRIRKGADWGTWEIEVLPFAGKGYRTSYGKFEFKARVEIYDPVDEVGYTGEGTFTFEVEPDWWGVIQEFWYDYWPEILAAIYLLGLLFKKKFYFFGALIRVRRIKVAFTGVDQIGQAEANANPPVKNLQMSALQMLTFILPFISQRVDVNCSDGITNSYYGSFTAVATTTSMTRRNRAKFRIKGSLNLQNISNIDNQPANKETLKNGRFTLDNFSVMGKSGFGNVKTFSSR